MAVEYLHIDIMHEGLVPFGAQSVRSMRIERHTIKQTGISLTSTRVKQLPPSHHEVSGVHVIVGQPFKNSAMHEAISQIVADPCIR